METVLEVKNLNKIFRNNRGIKDITFSVEEGEIFGLLGANGAGKTTTMKAISGLISKYNGDCFIMGKSIKTNIEETLYSVGCLIEKPSFYEYMSPMQNMKLLRKYYTRSQITDESIEEKLTLVGLWDVRNDKLSRFSLGMKQRMGLAMAMLNEPLLYILDEPSNGLDIEGIVEIRNIIIDICKNKRASFLISSHQSAEIEKLCDKVAIIHNGIVRDCASKEYVLDNFPSFEDYYLSCIGKQGGN